MSRLDPAQAFHLLRSLEVVEFLTMKISGHIALGADEMVVNGGVSIETNSLTMDSQGGYQPHVRKHPQLAIELDLKIQVSDMDMSVVIFSDE
jgi:hypothetical protein